MSRVFLSGHGLKRPLVFIFCAAGSLSQPIVAGPVDLSKAVHAALANSPQVKASEEQVESAKWRYVDAFSGHLPSLSVSSSYLINKKYLVSDVSLPGASKSIEIPQAIPTSVWTGLLQMPLFDGFATTNRSLAAEDLKSGAELNYQWSKFELERQVVLQFCRAVAAEQLLKATKQNVKNLEDHLRDVKIHQGVGLSTHYDVLRVEVQMSEARSEVLNSEDNLYMARFKLAELMGEDLSSSHSDLPVPVGELPDLNSGVVRSQSPSPKSRIDFEALELRVSGLEKSSTAARRHFYPKISLFAQYQYYNNQNDSPTDRSAFRSAYSTGISLNWTLFDGFSSTAKARQSLSAKAESEFDLAARRQKSMVDAEFWKRKFYYFLELFKAKTNDIAKSQESVRLATVGQKEGARTNSDLLDAESDLFRSKAGAINAQLGSIEAMINLELATGQSLKKFF